MRNTITRFYLSVLFIFGVITIGYSQTEPALSWTQYRGQNRAGASAEKLTEKDWVNSKPEMLWKKNIGSGFSELIISEGVIYTMFSEKIDSLSGFEYLAAFDEKTGNEIWRAQVDSIYIEIDGWGDGPRSTPTIDAEYIYSFSGLGKFSARTKKDGKLIWEHDFVKEYGSTRPRWGYACSPILIENKVIMEIGGTDGKTFMAFDKSNGNIVWNNGIGPAGYNSPLMMSVEGQNQFIFVNGKDISSYNLQGDTLWTYQLPFAIPIAMPVLIGSNKLFFSQITSGFVIIQVESNKATEVLRGGEMKNDFMTCVYHDGYIYGYHIAALRCISAETGEVKWSKRGFGKGSLILVDGKLIILSDKGKLAIAKASPDAYQELGTVQSIEGSITWTAPSFTDGKVYVRNQTEMACIKLN